MNKLLLLLVFLIAGGVTGQNLVVYSGQSGSLASGWNDFSWATHSLTDKTSVHSGDTYSLSMVATGWQGVYFHAQSNLNLGLYSSFQFWLNAGPSAVNITLTAQFVGTNNSLSLGVAAYTGNVLPSTWTLVTMPVPAFTLPAIDNNQISGFWIQGNGYNSPTVYFADITFVSASSSTPAPTHAPTSAPTSAPTPAPTHAATSAPTPAPTSAPSGPGASLTVPAVAFSNVVRGSNGVTSFNVNFQQAVSSLNGNHLVLTVTSTGARVSLSGATYTSSSGGTVWTVSNPNGFNPTNPSAQLTVQFTNAPPTVCSSPVALVSVSKPTTVVGTGTPASCTEAAFTNAVAVGGIITFNCGPNPVTITVTSVKNVPLTQDTVIDGNGLVTLSGGGKTRILAIQTTYDKKTPRVTLQNLGITKGYTTDVVNTTATTSGGGALYRLGGAFTIINCDFYGNQGPTTGQDVAGGAVYSVGGNDTTIVGSTFSNNMCSNGGAIGNLGNNFTIYNSVVNGNTASGTGGNPGNGGNGGGMSFDGQGVNTTICGTQVSYNNGGQFGGALFRVGYQYTDYITLNVSSFNYNFASGQAGAIYVQALSVVLHNSTIAFNTAPGGGGLALQYQAHYDVSGVTIANNTATSSLGGGLYINSGAGKISDTTLTGNVASGSFAASVAGSDSNTVLTRSIITNIPTNEQNIYVPLNCFSSSFSDGGGNIQWPQKRLDGNNDALCAAGVTEVDPQLSVVKDNGCVTWTAQAATGSPASNAGSRCPAGSTSPNYALTYANGQAVPRGPFTLANL